MTEWVKGAVSRTSICSCHFGTASEVTAQFWLLSTEPFENHSQRWSWLVMWAAQQKDQREWWLRGCIQLRFCTVPRKLCSQYSLISSAVCSGSPVGTKWCWASSVCTHSWLIWKAVENFRMTNVFPAFVTYKAKTCSPVWLYEGKEECKHHGSVVRDRMTTWNFLQSLRFTLCNQGGNFPDYSQIAVFRLLSESNKNGVEMHFECDFQPFSIQTFNPIPPIYNFCSITNFEWNVSSALTVSFYLALIFFFLTLAVQSVCNI